MCIRYDKVGGPVMEISPGRWIHVLPVTLLQLEHQIWSGNPAGLCPETLLAPRQSVFSAAPVPLSSILARGLTLYQAFEIASWLGGRLPTRSEWRMASRGLWSDTRVYESLAHKLARGVGDERLTHLTRVYAHQGSRRNHLIRADFGEFATEFPSPPYGGAYIMRESGTDTFLGDDSTWGTARDAVGFSCVFATSHVREASARNGDPDE